MKHFKSYDVKIVVILNIFTAFPRFSVFTALPKFLKLLL